MQHPTVERVTERIARRSRADYLARMGAVRDAGGSAQVAGRLPAMCAGATRGRDAMELSRSATSAAGATR